tara:strand:+ start:1899 stop:4922 length:3024 start_codon:yes stop_codon:yes gene_type:complete
MSEKLPVFAKIVAACNGNAKKAEQVYNELVKKYFNSVSLFGSVGDSDANAREFKATNGNNGGKKKGSGNSDDMEVDEDTARKAGEKQKDRWMGEEEVLPPAKRAKIARVSDSASSSSAQDAMGIDPVAGTELPYDILKQFVVEMKAMTMVNKTLRDYDEMLQSRYERPLSLKLVRLDLRYPDCYISEMQTLAMCMHPFHGLRSIAAYLCGMMVYNGSGRVTMYGVNGIAGVEDVIVPHYPTDSMEGCVYHKHPYSDFESIHGFCDAALIESIDGLAKELRKLIRTNDDTYMPYRLFKILERRVEMHESRIEFHSLHSQDKKTGAAKNAIWLQWQKDAAELLSEYQIAILSAWRSKYLGSIYPHGAAIARDAQARIISLGMTAMDHFHVSYEYMDYIQENIVLAAVKKRFRTPLFTTPVFDLEKCPKFLKYETENGPVLDWLKLLEAIKNRKDLRNIDDNIPPYPDDVDTDTGSLYRRAAESPLSEQEVEFSKVARSIEYVANTFMVIGERRGRMKKMDIESKDLVETGIDISGMEPLFSPELWIADQNKCAQSMLAVFVNNACWNAHAIDYICGGKLSPLMISENAANVALRKEPRFPVHWLVKCGRVRIKLPRIEIKEAVVEICFPKSKFIEPKVDQGDYGLLGHTTESDLTNYISMNTVEGAVLTYMLLQGVGLDFGIQWTESKPIMNAVRLPRFFIMEKYMEPKGEIVKAVFAPSTPATFIFSFMTKSFLFFDRHDGHLESKFAVRSMPVYRAEWVPRYVANIRDGAAKSHNKHSGITYSTYLRFAALAAVTLYRAIGKHGSLEAVLDDRTDVRPWAMLHLAATFEKSTITYDCSLLEEFSLALKASGGARDQTVSATLNQRRIGSGLGKSRLAGADFNTPAVVAKSFSKEVAEFTLQGRKCFNHKFIDAAYTACYKDLSRPVTVLDWDGLNSFFRLVHVSSGLRKAWGMFLDGKIGAVALILHGQTMSALAFEEKMEQMSTYWQQRSYRLTLEKKIPPLANLE